MATRFHATASVGLLAGLSLAAPVTAEQAALFDVNKCNCIRDLCTCPDVKGVFFTKAQVDALRAVPKPNGPIEMPDTLKQ